MRLLPKMSATDGQAVRALAEKMGVKLPPVVFGLHVLIASTDPIDTSEVSIGLSQLQMVAALEALARLPELGDEQRAGFAAMAQEARAPQLPYPRPADDGEKGGPSAA